jgi:hypothetical protein
LAKALAVTLSVLLIAAFSAWALLDFGPSKGLDSASAAPSDQGTSGYWMVASDGGVFNYGDAVFDGSTGGLRLNAPIVGMAATHDGGGYWLVASDGGVFTYGDAVFHGSTGGLHLNAPIVGMAATHDDGGYWLVASDGGVFTYGDAVFDGSTGGMHLNAPIVGMAATPDGGGYWLVASDGGVFTYGDAVFDGSTGGLHLNAPIVGMAATHDDGGYWLVASDGGVFNYGDAEFHGSTGGMHLNAPVVGMATDATGAGYWLVASDGGIFNYGDASFDGSAGGLHLNASVVALANGPLTTTTNDSSGTTTTTTTTNDQWSCTSNVPNLNSTAQPATVGTVNSQGTASAGAILTIPNAGSYLFLPGATGTNGQGKPGAITDGTTPSAIPRGVTIASIGGSTVVLSPGVTSIANGDTLDEAGYQYEAGSSCHFPTDTTDFVGMNDPTDLDGETNEVDQNVWSAICTNSSGGVIGFGPPGSWGIDDPSCAHLETSELQADSAQNFVFTNDTPTNSTGGVTAYSNAWAHGYAGPVDDYTSLTSTYNLSMPINSSTSAWAMQDDWFTEPGYPAGQGTYEVMIQYDFTNNGTCPSTWAQGTSNWGVVANDVMIDGVAWHVCDGQPAHNSDGTCSTTYPNCGAMVWKLGATEADRPALASTSGTIDIKAMVQWMETHDVPGENYPYMEPGTSIEALSEGWEIASTGGVPEQFVGKGFTVDATGAPAL